MVMEGGRWSNGGRALVISGVVVLPARRAWLRAQLVHGAQAGAGYREPPLEVEVGALVPVEWTAQVCTVPTVQCAAFTLVCGTAVCLPMWL